MSRLLLVLVCGCPVNLNETFDVGLDTRSSVIGKDNLMPFRSIGNIDKLTVKLGPVRMAEAEHKQMQYALANAKD